MNHSGHNIDWRKPLYDFAVKMQESGDPMHLRRAVDAFAYLGGYRDSNDRLYASREEFSRQYQEAIGRAQGARTSAEAKEALHHLQLFGGTPEYAEHIKEATRRITDLKELERRRERRRKILLAGAAVLAAVLFAVFTRYQHTVVHPRILEQARAEEAAGELEDAIETYKKLRYGPFSEEAEEEIRTMSRTIAYRKMRGGDYQSALDLLKAYGSSEDLRNLHMAWGTAYFRASQFEEALAEYDLAGEHSLDGRVCSSWAEHELVRGDAFRAVELMEQAAKDGKYGKRLNEMYLLRAESVIAAAFSSENAATPAVEFLREQGERLDDIDGQLLYCRALYEAGYDLAAVYPDGVKISNVHTELYLPTKENHGISAEASAGMRILPFRRTEVDSFGKQMGRSMLSNYIRRTPVEARMLPWNRKYADHYEVRLLPDVLYMLPENVRAENYEDCTGILLADTFFMIEGVVSIRKGRTHGGSAPDLAAIPEAACYPLFTAVDNVTLYEKGQENCFHIVDYRKQLPEMRERIEKEEEYSADYLPEILKVDGIVDLEGATSLKVREELGACWGSSDPEYLEETVRSWAGGMRQ